MGSWVIRDNPCGPRKRRDLCTRIHSHDMQPRKIPRWDICWMFHECHVSRSHVRRIYVGLSGISGPSLLRSDSDTATVLHCQIKTAQHVFSVNPSAQYGVICSPNNYLNSRRAKILEQKLQNFWCLETIILLSEQYFCSAAFFISRVIFHSDWPPSVPQVRKYVYHDADNLDTAFDAGGKVSIGLTATTIVSQWTWSATLLQSSTVASKVICHQ